MIHLKETELSGLGGVEVVGDVSLDEVPGPGVLLGIKACKVTRQMLTDPLCLAVQLHV